MRKKDLPLGAAREVEKSGALCLAFANSAAPRSDRRRCSRALPWVSLKSYEDLVLWGQQAGILDALGGERLTREAAAQPGQAAEVVAGAVELRAALLRMFTALAAAGQAAVEDLEALNAVFARSSPARRIVPGAGGFSWDWGGDAGALDRVLWPIAQSAGDLLASAEHRRLRQCAAPACRKLFLERSKRRRLWCDMNLCGNRAKRRRRRAR